MHQPKWQRGDRRLRSLGARAMEESKPRLGVLTRVSPISGRPAAACLLHPQGGEGRVPRHVDARALLTCQFAEAGRESRWLWHRRLTSIGDFSRAAK